MKSAKKLLMISGLGLALLGMAFGLYYAVFAEHQALDQIGFHLAKGFVYAASQRPADASASLHLYADDQYEYIRYVDVHSHWIGLGMLLLLFGIVFDRTGGDERNRMLIAWLLVLGSFVFPAGVLVQAFSSAVVGKIIAGIGSALVTLGLIGAAFGFLRTNRRSAD